MADTLHVDGTVIWQHADGRVLVSHPPDRGDRYVQQILSADEEAPGDPPDTYRRHDSDGADDTAGETRATHHTGAGLRMGLAA